MKTKTKVITGSIILFTVVGLSWWTFNEKPAIVEIPLTESPFIVSQANAPFGGFAPKGETGGRVFEDKEYHPKKTNGKIKSSVPASILPTMLEEQPTTTKQSDLGLDKVVETFPSMISDPEDPINNAVIWNVGPPQPPKPDEDLQVFNKIVVGVASDPGKDGGASPVPEPMSLLLVGSGLVGLAAWRRKCLEIFKNRL